MAVTARIVCAFLLLTLAACKAGPRSNFETKLMTHAKRTVFVGNRNQQSPLPVTKENLDAGREAFSHYCVACHGLDGQKTGVPFADRMSPPVPSLASADIQAYSDGQLKWVIDYGVFPSGMPGSKGILNDDEIWSIVQYLRHLPPAGSLGEPQMYSGDDNASKKHTRAASRKP